MRGIGKLVLKKCNESSKLRNNHKRKEKESGGERM